MRRHKRWRAQNPAHGSEECGRQVDPHMVGGSVIVSKLRMSRGPSRPATCRRSGTHWLPRSRRLALVTAAILGAGVLFAARHWRPPGPPSSPTEGGTELPLGGSTEWECQDAAETGQEAAGCGGGGSVSGVIANVEDPDDKTPKIESQCNKTGQGCTGHRGGGKGGGGSTSACNFVAGGAGGLLGGAVGSLGGPGGTMAGGAVGSWLGSKVCG
jgi:hypothetical protein